MQHYYGGNEILIFLIEVVLAGPPSPLTKYLKDCFKSSRIPGSFGQVIHLPIPDKLVGFHQLLLEPFHINIDEKLCTMYPLTSPYYTQQFGVSILYTKQYSTYIDIPVPLFSSSHPIYSTPSLSDTAGVVVGIVLGNPKNIILLHGLPNFSVFLCQNMALMRVVIVNKGSLLGEISSKHLL